MGYRCVCENPICYVDAGIPPLVLVIVNQALDLSGPICLSSHHSTTRCNICPI